MLHKPDLKKCQSSKTQVAVGTTVVGLIKGQKPAAEELTQLREAEKASGRKPDPTIDAVLRAETIEGGRESIVTDYMLKLLGLDVRATSLLHHL